jgi:ribosomal protein S18 acetylase RimI-like enzyme
MVGFDVRNIILDDYNDLIKLNSNLDYSSIKSMEKDNNSMIIVAQLNDEVIGYINYNIVNDINYNKSLVINNIVVEEKYRGLGVGHQLMIEAEKHARIYNVVYLVALNDNYVEEEVEFYNKQ